MSEVMSDNEQPSLLPETGGLPVLSSGGEALPAVPGRDAQDECAAAQRVCESAADVRPDGDQTDSAGTQSRLKFPWNEENTAEAVRLWKSSKSGGEIALILGTTRGSVIGRMRRLGLLGSSERVNLYASKWTPALDTELTRLAAEGLSRADIASQMGMTYDSVHSRLKRLGIRTRPRPKKPRAFCRRIHSAPAAIILNPTHIMDLTRHQCRYPLWNTGDDPDFMYCGAETISNMSWCAGHSHLVFGPGTLSERAVTNCVPQERKSEDEFGAAV